jgi:hypothetical protein
MGARTSNISGSQCCGQLERPHNFPIALKGTYVLRSGVVELRIVEDPIENTSRDSPLPR